MLLMTSSWQGDSQISPWQPVFGIAHIWAPMIVGPNVSPILEQQLNSIQIALHRCRDSPAEVVLGLNIGFFMTMQVLLFQNDWPDGQTQRCQAPLVLCLNVSPVVE